MSLTTSFDTARSGLSLSTGQIAVTSRNIARAGVDGASRKIANATTLPGQGARLAAITRATDAALLDKMLIAASTAAQKSAAATGFDRLGAVLGDMSDETSPASLMGKLRDALQIFSDNPGDAVRGQTAVAVAKDLARALNDGARSVQSFRAEADGKIAGAVDRLNGLLTEFGALNNAVAQGARAGQDITDALDDRDGVLKNIAEIIGVRTISGPDGRMAIFTDSGVTLFAETPRAVTFTSTPVYAATTSGAAVFVDGVAVTDPGSGMPVSSGEIAGLAALRDTQAVTYQNQLDEIARSLIVLFAEKDVSATPTGPDAPGLFTYSGAPAMPASALTPGLAASIAVAARADPAQGGDVFRLRDGGISNPGNPAYVSNPSGLTGYSDLLIALFDGFSALATFDPAAQAGTSASPLDFASSSTAWLQEARRAATLADEQSQTRFQRAKEAHSNKAGVNLDDEMARLLEFERSYQASAKLLSAIDAMYGALFDSLR
jgi:flagellar hook-associated protein 1 FlgK